MHRHVVFGEIMIDEIAEARIERHRFVQRRSDTEHHAADRLRPCGFCIQDTTGREYAEHAP